jgi:hypothetical protein
VRSIPALFINLFAASLLAVESPEYTAMRAARPDGRSVAVHDLTITRDVYRLHFKSGTFHLLTPLAGRTWGAVFLGSGRFELRPSAEVERRHLALVTNQKDLEIFSDEFDRMVLLFSDGTADEITTAGTVATAAPDPAATSFYIDYLEEQKRRYQINLHLRVLQDLLAAPAPRQGVFIAPVDGKKFARALIVVDPRGISALAARFAFFSGEESAYFSFDDDNGGFWYLNSAGPAGALGRGKAPRMLVDVERYAVETTIEGNQEISGTTTIDFTPLVSGGRVLPLNIQPKLRLRRAVLAGDSGDADLGIVQEEVELGRMARLFRAEVADADAAIVFPEPMAEGKKTRVRLEYRGSNVLLAFGPDSYSVRARESWYPNPGTFIDLAEYDLTYRYPKSNDLISTGKLISERVDGKEKIAVWKAETPMRVAGFNYGRFQKTSRRDEPSATDIDVFTSRDHAKFAKDTLADAMNTARVGTAFFGKPPYSPVSVTQQAEWFFGQSWPSLIYLPPLALTSSTERVMMFEDAPPDALYSINEFAKMVGWHEFAHQWWGHAVGWASYRDQWLSEGFADFTAALVLQLTEGVKKYNDYWERQRRDLLQTQRGNQAAYNDAAPISQGHRAATRYTPGAGQGVVYAKGGYVLHMLRMLMRDRRKQNPDENFMKMMNDFVTSYSGKSPSTADFQKVVERHMTDAMNAGGNGKMDWFFDQWVYGTDVPRLKSTLTARDAGGGKYRLSGAVSQEGVGPQFVSLIPIYADFGGDSIAQMGSVRLIGNTSQTIDTEVALPKPPRRMVINFMHEVLARD